MINRRRTVWFTSTIALLAALFVEHALHGGARVPELQMPLVLVCMALAGVGAIGSIAFSLSAGPTPGPGRWGFVIAYLLFAAPVAIRGCQLSISYVQGLSSMTVPATYPVELLASIALTLLLVGDLAAQTPATTEDLASSRWRMFLALAQSWQMVVVWIGFFTGIPGWAIGIVPGARLALYLHGVFVAVRGIAPPAD